MKKRTKRNFFGLNPRRGGKAKGLPVPLPSQRRKAKARPDRPGIEICRTCGAVFWKKLWRQDLGAITRLPNDYRITYVICPACQAAVNRLFEGEIEVTGVPAERFGEAVRQIRNVGEQARSRDPMDRILTFEAAPGAGRIRVTTSENQLAKRIARKLKETYRAKVTIALSKEESTIRIRVAFK